MKTDSSTHQSALLYNGYNFISGRVLRLHDFLLQLCHKGFCAYPGLEGLIPYLRHTLQLALLLSEWVMEPDTLKKDPLWANLPQGSSGLLLLPDSLFSHSLRAFGLIIGSIIKREILRLPALTEQFSSACTPTHMCTPPDHGPCSAGQAIIN